MTSFWDPTPEYDSDQLRNGLVDQFQAGLVLWGMEKTIWKE